MHRVTRPEKPETLANNAELWTRELMEQIVQKGSYSKVNDIFKNRYKANDVVNSLKKMYSNLCCFCESQLGVQTYERIEHLKPKSKFPELSFDWNNLNLVCEVCNTSFKKDNWDPACPFLDPSQEDISSFLKLNLITGEYNPIDDNLRAKYTIEHTGLNRKPLVVRRNQIIDFCAKLISKIGKEQFIENASELKPILEYPTTYQTIMDELQDRSKA